MTVTLSNVVASIPDDRDFLYLTRQGPFPIRTDLKPEVYEVEDQGTVGSCTCNSSVSACENLKPASYSRLFPYWVTRNTIENRPGQEGATSLRDALRALSHFGTPLESQWAYDVTKVDVEPDAAAYAAALTLRITRYERIFVPAPGYISPRTSDWQTPFEQAIKSALSEKLSVVFACLVGEQIRGLTGPWQTHKMAVVDNANGTNPKIGGHAIEIIGNDDSILYPCPGMVENGSWLVQNSWGPAWGDGGFFGYPYAALASDVIEAWVVRGFSDVMINPVPQIPYVTDPMVVLDWYHRVFRNDVTDPMSAGVQYWAMDKGFPRSFLGTWRDAVLAKVAELEATLP